MAINAEALVISSDAYKCVLTLNNNQTFILTTLAGISMAAKRESEPIHAIGQQEPIAQKRNSVAFSGKLEIQVGELEIILRASGLAEGTQIENASLGITSLNPSGLQRVYSGLNIDSESIDIKAKDKQTLVSMDWNALTVTGI